MLSPNPSIRLNPPAVAHQAQSKHMSPPNPKRASSKEAVNGAQDPVLARYHSIKKELEQAQGGGKGTTPAPLHQTTTAVGALYTTPLTPNNSTRGHYGGYTTSPMVSSTYRTTSPALIPRDERLEQIQRHLTHQGNAATTTPALKQAYNQLDESRHVNITLDSQLQMERGQVDGLVLKVQELESALHRSEESRRVAQENAEEAKREVDHLHHLQAQVQRRMQEAERGNQDGKVNQGKLAAMEEVLASKNYELEEERRKVHSSSNRLEELMEQNDKLQKLLSQKDRDINEGLTTGEVRGHELQRLKKRLEDVVVEEQLLQKKVQEKDNVIHALNDKIETDLLAHKEEGRQKTRRMDNLELELVSATEKVRELEMTKENVFQQLRTQQMELEEKTKQLKDAQANGETLKVLSAQESIVKDELRYEIDRYKKLVEDLRDEVRSQEDAREELEQQNYDLQQDRIIRSSLEDQLRVMHDTLKVNEQDGQLLKERYHETVKRLQNSEERMLQLEQMRDRLSETEAALEGKKMSVEVLHNAEQDLRGKITEKEREIDTKKEEIQNLKKDFVEAHEALHRTERDLQEAQFRTQHMAELEGKLEAMQRVVQEKQDELAHHKIELSKAQGKNRQLECDIETLLEVRNQVESLNVERNQTLMLLREQEDAIHLYQRDKEALEIRVKQREDEIRELREMSISSGDQISRLQVQLSDKASLETQVRTLTVDLAHKSDEVLRSRERMDDFQSRLNVKEEAVETERRRRNDLEQQLQYQQNEYSHLQVDVGKTSVMLEALEADKNRLHREGQEKQAQNEKLFDQVQDLKSQIRSQESLIEQANYRESCSKEKMASLSNEITELQKQAESYRSSRDQLEVATRSYQSQVHGMEQQCEVARETEERWAICDNQRRKAEQELTEATELLSAVRAHNNNLQAKLSTLERVAIQHEDLKVQAEKHSRLVRNYEQDENEKTRTILDKERELGRSREKISALSADLESERQRRKQYEIRVKDLESECQRASALDGQVAGLQTVVAQRQRDIEEERATSAELRSKLRHVERSSSQRSHSVSTYHGAEPDHRLAAKEEIILRLQQEERRRTELIEQLKADYTRCDQERQRLGDFSDELKAKLIRSEATWSEKYQALQNSVLRSQQHMSSADELRLMEGDLLDTKNRLSEAMAECGARDQEIRELRNQVLHNQHSKEVDLKERLLQSESLRHDAQQLLQEKEAQLSVATANISAMERRIHQIHSAHQSPARPVPALSPNRPSLPSPIPQLAGGSGGSGEQASAIIEAELERWREKRKMKLQQDDARSRDYSSHMGGTA